jgi:hypothetical protein
MEFLNADLVKSKASRCLDFAASDLVVQDLVHFAGLVQKSKVPPDFMQRQPCVPIIPQTYPRPLHAMQTPK